ncbi:hypothetical protein ZIOFF_029559 [Zingiber officinale]|uniref:Dynamin-type G domain-containing protein n=1 Tax=Zingiber officinale TaxID=94328 RepID=A0A8J5GWU7_ZINOF|nr:hypothetical protein ZIOFF_029559 [Zingiber officinale]
MEAIEELTQLAESIMLAAALLADEDIDEGSASKRASTFLNVVALGNVGVGKSSVLNSVVGHPVLPTGENGATRAPIIIDLVRDVSLSSKSIMLQIDNKSQQVSASALRHSLQERLSKGTGSRSSGKNRADEIYLKLRSCTAPPLKLIDLPGLDQRSMDESVVGDYAARNDAILMVIIAAAQASDVTSSRALRMAKEFDAEGTRTVGIISKIDQAAGDQKSIAAVQALLLNQGPKSASDIPWVALIEQSVSIASAQAGAVGSNNSLEAWNAETESLKAILTGAPQSKLGRVGLVDTLAKQIRERMKIRFPNLLTGLQGKSQIVQDELFKLGEQMANTAEGTRAIALQLCREFEDTFLQHISSGEGAGWKVVATFEGNFPNKIKQLPLDKHFDINNVKRVYFYPYIVLEADGYQPYLISPEKGLRSLIKCVLELAKEPSKLCVDEVHRVLLDIVSASANGTPGLGRYPPFKKEVLAIASAALENFRNEARKMVVALVDMERSFVPPQHFIRLVQRRFVAIPDRIIQKQSFDVFFVASIIVIVGQFVFLHGGPFRMTKGKNSSSVNARMERQRREDELKHQSSKKANEESSSRPGIQQTGGSLKSMKDKTNQSDKDAKEGSSLQIAGPSGEITAGCPPSLNWTVELFGREVSCSDGSSVMDACHIRLLWIGIMWFLHSSCLAMSGGDFTWGRMHEAQRRVRARWCLVHASSCHAMETMASRG